MKVIVLAKKRKQREQLIKIERQLGELRRALHLKPWHSFFSQQQHPWYLILGHDDQEVHTWLEQSKLVYTSRQESLEYHDHLPHINIYTTAQAVFIHAPVQFWQQPGKGKHQSLNRWQSFCQLLKQQRRFQSLNGLILLLNIQTLQDEAALNTCLATLKPALQGLAEQSYGRTPVYCILTGLETLAGFSAYMHKLKPEQKHQPFGLMLPDNLQGESCTSEPFARLFKELLQQLDQKLLQHLDRTLSLKENSDMLQFPLSLAAQKPILSKILTNINHASSIPNRLLLRGIHFIKIGADPYFGSKLVPEIFLKETGLATHGIKAWCYQHRKTVFSMSIISCMLLILIWLLGVLSAERYLKEVQQGLLSTHNNPSSLQQLATIQQLSQLHASAYPYFYRYLGIIFPSKIDHALLALYIQALQQQLEPELVAQLATNLDTAITNGANATTDSNQNTMEHDAALYNALSAYLMFNEVEHFDAETIKAVLQNFWTASNYPRRDVTLSLNLFQDLVHFGVQKMTLDQDRIAKARAILGQQPLSIQTFFALKASLSPKLSDLTLGGPQADTLWQNNKSNNIDGFYTVKGHQLFNQAESQGVLSTLKASWVLGQNQGLAVTNANINAITSAVTTFYQEQYLHTWHEVLWGMSIKPLNNVNAAQTLLNDLSSNQNPWRILSQQVQEQLGDAGGNQSPEGASLNTLYQYISNQEQQALIVNAFTALAQSLSTIQSPKDAIHLSTLLLKQEVSTFNDLAKLAASAPEPIHSWLNQLLSNVTQAVFNDASHALVQSWQHNVAGRCNSLGMQAFPLNAFSNEDLSLDNFSQLFAPQGLLRHLNQDNLPALLEALSHNRSAYGARFMLPNWLENNLSSLPLIQRAFFSANGKPSLAMSWTPLYLSKNMAKFSISFNTATLMYQNGPRIAQTVNWPPLGPIRLQFAALNGANYQQQYQGTWALLRLLQSATITRLSPNNYQITFSNHGLNASYQVKLNHGDFAGVLLVKSFTCNK